MYSTAYASKKTNINTFDCECRWTGVIIGSTNDFAPVECQAITWHIAELDR